MNTKEIRETLHKRFQKFSDDWLPAEIIFPTYSGPRNLATIEFRRSNAEVAYQRHRREYQQMQYLKRKNWIQIKKTENGLLVALTDEGKMEKMRRSMSKAFPLSKGKVCLVMFDIPESAKKGRQEFRRFLKRTGFKMNQLSVWESELDVCHEVVAFAKRSAITKWVAVYVAEKKS